MSERPSDFWLADWLVQPSLNRAVRGDETVHLRAKVTDVLVHLAAHAGDVVSKEDLFEHVWNGESVSDSALTRVITELRQMLGDEVARPRLLETIPKRGYRLIGPVRQASDTVVEGHVGMAPETKQRTRTIAVAIVLSVFLLLGVTAWGLLGAGNASTVAVLPFENLSGDPAHDYLAAGLTRRDHSGARQLDPARLSVIGRTSTLAYRGTTRRSSNGSIVPMSCEM